MNEEQNALLIFGEELAELAVELLVFQSELLRGPLNPVALQAEWNDLLGARENLSFYGIDLKPTSIDEELLKHAPAPSHVNYSRALRDLSIELLRLQNQVSKALRFGIDEQRDLPTSNRERIAAGWEAFLGNLSRLAGLGVDLRPDHDAIGRKFSKIGKYTQYSRELGQVD